MSGTPPRKKLRQISLTDMFKPSNEDPKNMEESFLQNKSSDKDSAGSSSTMQSSDIIMESFSSGSSTTTASAHEGSSSSKGKTPRKNQEILEKTPKKSVPPDKIKNTTSKGGNANGSCESSPSKVTWRGCPLSSLQVLGNCSRHIPTVHPTSDHTVMIKLPLPDSGPPEPHPTAYSDVWDQHHVRMPCSPKSLYPVTGGSDPLAVRWSVIYKSLQRDMKNVNDLQRAILEYNSRYAEKWNFKGLRELLEKEFEDEERDYFFQHTLPSIAALALDLPNLVTQPPPLLTRHSTHSITLSQVQIASLLANAFFCTFPRRNAKGGDTEYASYPDINFNRMFLHKEQASLEKLKCILNYFRRVTKKKPEGLVTFTRQHIASNDLPSWETLSHHLPNLHLDSCGVIEEKEGLLQVDFANKFIGGGVLGLGCVQEEIRFVLSPEMIVSRLFTQVLDKTEALVITGAEQYNQSSGYASSFCWTGSYEDLTKYDSWKRRMCQVVAIDALHFSRPRVQYKPPLILRELNKVYAGYRALKGSMGTPIGVATGNWGCGAFNGNPRLKALIQLAVCGYTGRDIAYFTFGDEKLRDDVSTMHIFLKENNVTVGELVQVLCHYGQRQNVDGSDLYSYIYNSLGSYDSDTDEENGDYQRSFNKEKMDISQKESSSSKSTKKILFNYSKGNNAEGSGSNLNQEESCNKPVSSSSTQSDSKKEENLTEEDIVQALMECDRLVEGQKRKNREGATELQKDNKFLIESKNTDNKSQSEKHSMDVTKKEMKNISAKTSKSEPVSLLACLDGIDKQAVT